MFGTVIAHGMRKRQAQNLGLVDEKEDIRELDDGESFVDIQGYKQIFYARIPFLGESQNARIAGNERYIDARSTRSASVPETFIDELGTDSGTDSGTGGNVLEKPVERIGTEEERIASLAAKNASRDQIILELYGATRGGGKKYQDAKKRYEEIIARLISEGKIEQK